MASVCELTIALYSRTCLTGAGARTHPSAEAASEIAHAWLRSLEAGATSCRASRASSIASVSSSVRDASAVGAVGLAMVAAVDTTRQSARTPLAREAAAAETRPACGWSAVSRPIAAPAASRASAGPRAPSPSATPKSTRRGAATSLERVTSESRGPAVARASRRDSHASTPAATTARGGRRLGRSMGPTADSSGAELALRRVPEALRGGDAATSGGGRPRTATRAMAMSLSSPTVRLRSVSSTSIWSAVGAADEGTAAAIEQTSPEMQRGQQREPTRRQTYSREQTGRPGGEKHATESQRAPGKTEARWRPVRRAPVLAPATGRGARPGATTPVRHNRGGQPASSATTRLAPAAGRAPLLDAAATGGGRRATAGDARGGTPARALPPATAGP